MKNKELNIVVDESYYTCSDGCCTEYGTHVTVNGVDLPCNNYQDVGTHLKKVLEHLGYTVNLTETYNGKQF